MSEYIFVEKVKDTKVTYNLFYIMNLRKIGEKSGKLAISYLQTKVCEAFSALFHEMYAYSDQGNSKYIICSV